MIPLFSTHTLFSVSTDAFLASYSSAGNFLWVQAFFNATDPAFMHLAVGGNGTLYAGGVFGTSTDMDPSATTATITGHGSGLDNFIAAYNSTNGNYKWAYDFGGTGADNLMGLALDNTENIFVCGSFKNTVDFDPGASTVNLISAGAQDAFIAKYDSAGNFNWAKKFGNSGYDEAAKILCDGVDGIYFCGRYTTNIDMDASAGTHLLFNNGSSDVFIARYDLAGNYIWSFGMGSNGTDYGSDIQLCANGDLHLMGSFQSAMDCDFSSGSHTLLANQNFDFFFARYDAITIGLNDTKFSETDIVIYPNPAKDKIYFILNKHTQENYAVNFFNILGENVKSLAINSETNSIDINNLTNGIYFISVRSSGGQLFSRKLVIER